MSEIEDIEKMNKNNEYSDADSEEEFDDEIEEDYSKPKLKIGETISLNINEDENENKDEIEDEDENENENEDDEEDDEEDGNDTDIIEDDDDDEDDDIKLDIDEDIIANENENEKTKNVKKANKKKNKKDNTEEVIKYGIDSDDDYDEYLEKFDNNDKENYILNYHPENISHNYDEIQTILNVVRDDKGNIIDPFHRTIPIMTKYEKARILGLRAKQINSGMSPMIEIQEDVIDGYLIAQLELQEKKIPFIIRRPLPNGTSEYWRISDLEIIN